MIYNTVNSAIISGFAKLDVPLTQILCLDLDPPVERARDRARRARASDGQCWGRRPLARSLQSAGTEDSGPSWAEGGAQTTRCVSAGACSVSGGYKHAIQTGLTDVDLPPRIKLRVRTLYILGQVC